MKILPDSQFEVTDMLFNLSTPDLKAPEKFLLVLLSHYGNELGVEIFPSLTTLAEKSCMSRAAVAANLKKLEEKGYIGRRKGGIVDGQNVTTKYIINMEKLGYEYKGGKLIGKKRPKERHLKAV